MGDQNKTIEGTLDPIGPRRWLFVQAFVWMPVLIASGWCGSDPAAQHWLLLIAAALMVASYVALWTVLGVGRRVADWVTLARFVGLAAVLVACAAYNGVSWFLWTALAILVASDLLDGWAARLFGGSEAGALLDQETDQLATVVLALLGVAYADAGIWLLALPAFRYLYTTGLGALGLPVHDPKPREGNNTRGRIICAIVLTSMVALLAPVVSPVAARWISVAIVLLLGYSFASDTGYLLQQYRREKLSQDSVSPIG